MSIAPSRRQAKKLPGDKRTARERALAVFARMTRNSLSLQDSCHAEGQDHSNLLRMVRKDEELRIEYEIAREIVVETRRAALGPEADEVMKTAKRLGHKATAYVSAFVAKVNVAKWEAERLLPKVYGNRIDVNHSGSIDLAGRLAKARERTAE